MSQNLQKVVIGASFVFVSILLLLHILELNFIVIDNITLLLITLLMVIVLLPKITKIKWGDLEAEIGQKEIKKVRHEVNSLPQSEKENNNSPKLNEISNEIHLILESDPILALAKLRIEIEKTLKRILQFSKKQVPKMGIIQTANLLEREKLLDRSYIGPLKEVIYLCNRAIHGEEINEKNASSILEIGLNLLDRLYFDYTMLMSKPFKKIPIKEKELENYFDSKYEVETVIPLVKNPTKNKYLLTKEELDDFLENYPEYAEFIIGIKRLRE